MKELSIFFLLLVFSANSFSQKNRWRKPRYIAKIENKTENFIFSGALYDVTDSSLILTCSSCKKDEIVRFRVPVYSQKMDFISIKPNSHFYNWLLAGTVAGATGFLFAFVKFNDEKYQEPYSFYLASFSAGGLLPFVSAGLFRNFFRETKIEINKDKSNLMKNKETIKKYCFVE